MSADPRLEQIELINRYCHALDMRRWDELRSLFTKDAVLKARMVERGVPGPAETHVVGPDAMLGMIQQMWRTLGSTHHMVSNHVIDVAADGQSASGSCYLRAYHAGAGDRAHLFEESLARFDFETVKVDGEWKVRHWDEAIFVMLGGREVFGGG